MRKKIQKNNVIVLGNRNLDTFKEHSLYDYVLRVIWREHRISRIDIAKKLGLARSTVSEIVKELLLTDFVNEYGIGISSGGRCPVVLEFNDDAKYVLGIDIGATHISVALTNLRGKPLVWKEKKHQVRDDPAGTWKIVFELCDKCREESKFDLDNIMSIGVSYPSPVDPEHPEQLSEGIIPGWQGKSGIEELSKHFNVPVYIDNDANLGALAEHWWGAGRGIDNLVYIKLANGIGAGYVLNGQIYRGASGIAGEMSHMSINLNGNHCGCGLKGCLATYLASWALEYRANQLSTKYNSKLKANISVKMIEDAALIGDELALRVVKESAEYLSVAVTSLINLVNPSMVIFGGSLTRLGDILVEPIRDKVNKSNLVPSVRPTKIKISQLGTKATAIGAATLALEQRFSEPNFYNEKRQIAFV